MPQQQTDSKGAERANMSPLPRKGAEGAQRRQGFVYTRTPVPSSTPVHRHLASERFARPAPPLPEKETDAISIADCQTFPLVFPNPGLRYTKSPNPLPSPPKSKTRLCNYFYYNSIQSQDLSQRSLGARLAPLPLTGGCGSAPGGHAAPAPLPRPEEGRDLGADRDRRLASTPKKPPPQE